MQYRPRVQSASTVQSAQDPICRQMVAPEFVRSQWQKGLPLQRIADPVSQVVAPPTAQVPARLGAVVVVVVVVVGAAQPDGPGTKPGGQVGVPEHDPGARHRELQLT